MNTNNLTQAQAQKAVVQQVQLNRETMIKGLLGLHARQTQAELEMHRTIQNNGQGLYPRHVPLFERAVLELKEGKPITNELHVTQHVSVYGRQLTEILAADLGIRIVPAKRGRPAKVVAPLPELLPLETPAI